MRNFIYNLPKKGVVRLLLAVGVPLVLLTAAIVRVNAVSERRFPGLKTDASNSLIDLGQIRSGGPGKDGIPALNKPKFTTLSRAGLRPDAQGVLVDIKDERRFYPYNILVWHEIVNDTVGGKDISVTYCPLCGSAIVFDRDIDGQTVRFGVSGLLFESNLLMYDDKTESLWSQARGQAVVGRLAGTRLQVVDAQLLTVAQVRKHYPDAKVLSDRTGYSRDYKNMPYGGYESSDRLYFPVSVNDSRYPRKMMFYIVPVGEKSVAFPLAALRNRGEASLDVDGKALRVTAEDHLLRPKLDGAPAAGYYEMWFSWATHHQKNGVVWKP